MGVPAGPRRRGVRPRGEGFEVRGTVGSDTLDFLDEQAAAYGCPRTTYVGRILEALVGVGRHLTPREWAQLDAVLLRSPHSDKEVLDVVLEILQRRCESTRNQI